MTQTALKKRLGQFFSGEKVAKLLVSMCSLSSADSVIDPMAGIGDMLSAVVSAGVSTDNVYAIEIDPEAGQKCKASFSSGSVYIGDAFSSEPYRSFGRTSWDLVITNPPYVRYQSMSNYEDGGITLKSSAEIRSCLFNIVASLEHLPDKEKDCFLKIIKDYSGLSDLAVPSWLLCAAMVKLGGTLAMVVPESWISRDYAQAVKFMLLKFFDVQYIVEDLNSAWFSDALVKTNLLVAKRISLRDNLRDVLDLKYKHIKLSASLIGESGLVDGLTYLGNTGIDAFKKLLHNDTDDSGDGYDMKHISMGDMLIKLIPSRFLDNVETASVAMASTSIPKDLLDIIGTVPPVVADIKAWGFQVGQGLRTGANRFFYATHCEKKNDIDYVLTDDLFGRRIIPVPDKYSLPALRYQSDIKDGFVVDANTLPHRLLYIQETIPSGTPLAEYITEAGALPIESAGRVTTFPELSAVKPNIRPGRDWYMLPVLANRHLPQLSISRVNHKSTRCSLISEGVVVDANFSTLWSESKQDAYAMFALLNSSWVQAYLETISTIMGGGALKVEATHIRQLLLPYPTKRFVNTLSKLGHRLAETGSTDTLCEIDHVVICALQNATGSPQQEQALRVYVQTKVNARLR